MQIVTVLHILIWFDQHFESILIEQGIDSDGTINQQMLKTDAEKIKWSSGKKYI